MTDWITISERVPEPGSTVLVHIDSADCYYAIYMWGSVGSDRNITHWMPLSKPPANPQDTIDRIKANSYFEPDDNSHLTASLHKRI